MAKLTRKKFIEMSPVAIDKMTVKQLRPLLRQARELFTKQEEKFKKYEKTLYSPALEKMQTSYEEKGKKSISRMARNDLRNEIYRLQDFFESKTSTVPGAREVTIEQDARIFGVDERGKPKKRMTLEERTRFWSLYNEFKNMKKATYVNNRGSFPIQQAIGQMMIEGRRKKKETPMIDFFDELEKRLDDIRKQEDWEMNNYEYGDNTVFSGKRNG